MWVMESKGLRGFGQFMWFGEVVCQETISATTFMFNLSPRSFAYFYSTVFLIFLLMFLCYTAISSISEYFFKVLLRTLFCVFHYFLGRIHTGGSQSLYRGLRDTSFWDGNFSSLLQKELLCWTVAPLILDFLMLLSPSPLPFTFLMRVRAQSL